MLSEAPGSVRLIAGGTDLLLDLQQGRHQPVDLLVDVNRIPDMLILEERRDHFYIGAAVPLNKVSSSPLTIRHAQSLSESAGQVGGPQVRNSATLGGNVAHALPAADGMISLLALDAVAVVANKNGLRTLCMKDLFLGPGKSTLDPRGDILVGFQLPLIQRHQASAFSRVMRPQGVALPILNMSCWLERDGNVIRDVRIALGPAGPTPQRGIAAEEVLRGKTLSKELVHEAYEALLGSIKFRTSPQRATAEYRRELCGVLLDRVLHTAWDRAAQV